MENSLIFRSAKTKDLNNIIQLLSEDEFGSSREAYDPDYILPSYEKAFLEILSNPFQYFLVVEKNNQLIGTCQLTYLPSLTLKGTKRMHIEGVRITESERNHGLGTKMLLKCIELAKENQCGLIELTTNKKREKAKNFYEHLGFKASHEGFKLFLNH